MDREGPVREGPPAAGVELATPARRLLRPGGKLLLFVPFERERRYRIYRPDEPNHHLYSWNVQTLGNLMTELGFELLDGKVACFGYDRIAAVIAFANDAPGGTSLKS